VDRVVAILAEYAVIRSIAGAIGLLAAAASAVAQARAHTDAIVIRDAWVRESTATRTASSAYLTLENRGDTAVALVRVTVDGAATAEIHTIADDHGQAAMLAVSVLAVPAHATVDLAPGGTHVMLTGIARPFQAGRTIVMRLAFDDGRARTADAIVRPLSAMSAR
jgi:periplasmic copper chaperone A